MFLWRTIENYPLIMFKYPQLSKYGLTVPLIMFPVEDLEMNDGSAEKPYFMSKGMMKILGKKNKLEDPKSKSKEKEK